MCKVNIMVAMQIKNIYYKYSEKLCALYKNIPVPFSTLFYVQD